MESYHLAQDHNQYLKEFIFLFGETSTPTKKEDL